MEFKKIELNNNQNQVKKSFKLRLPKFSLGKTAKKKLLIIFGFFGFLVLFLAFFLILPVYQIYGQVLDTKKQAEITYKALKDQDIDLAETEILKTKEEIKNLNNTVNKISWVGYIPFIGNYYKDIQHSIHGGIAGVEAGEIALKAIKPYSDLLGFKSGSSFVEKSTEDRLQTAIITLDKITPKLGDIAKKLEIVQKEINAIEPSRYPEKIKGKEVRSKLAGVQDKVNKMAGLFIDARPFLEVFPDLVGAYDPKTYLVIFQNDKELRPTGGFITAYAYFLLDKGKMQVLKSDDIYNLDNARTKKISAPEELLKYHKNVFNLNLRDSNLSPDFKISMDQFEELYSDVNDKLEIDGIIAVDTNVLVEAMKILGPIPAYGITFTAEPDKRCNGCPQVVYEIEEYADVRVGHVRENRKDIIGVLLYQIMQKALGVSPGQYWGKLFQMSLDEVQQKHILAYFHDKEAQKGAEALNLAGRIKQFDGDYLHINDTNFAGAKSNMFTNHFVKQDIEIAQDGKVTKTLTLDYKNIAKASPGCNLERGGLCLNGLLRNWIRIYVPKGSKLLDFKGSKTEPVVKKDLDKTVFEGFFTVSPEGQTQIKVVYELPFKVEKDKYLLLVQKQPGTLGHEYIINYNGKEIEKFDLITDKEFNFKF